MIRKTKFLFGFLWLILFGCSGEQEKILCKRWQVRDIVFLNEEQSFRQSDTMQGDMKSVTKNILKDILMKNIYEFRSDGTYLTGNSAGNSEGEWKLERKTIRFISSKKDAEKKEKIVPFELLTEDSLVLVMKNDQTSFEMKLVLVPLAHE